MSEYLFTNLPRYVKTTPREIFANSVVREGAVLLFSEDGENLVAKLPDGTFTEIGSGLDTSDATATAGDIVNGKTAYVAGEKVTGTHTETTYDLTNLTAENIRSGVTINGVTGTMEEGLDTSDATAVEKDIINGKTAYVNGVKIDGTMLRGLSLSRNEMYQYVADNRGYVEKGDIVLDFGASTSGTANADCLLQDTTAWVNGEKITGTIPVVSASMDGNTVTVPAGYHESDGTFTVEAGIDTSDATATSDDILAGKSAYVNGEKVSGQMPIWDGALTITPSASTQNVLSACYVPGNLQVLGDSNLVAENIKSGVSIFGVEGTHEGEGWITIYDKNYGNITVTELPTYDGEWQCFATGVANYTFETAGKYCSDNITIYIGTDLTAENVRYDKTIGDVYGLFTADADATADDIAEGKIAYVKGEKVVGTMQAAVAEEDISNYAFMVRTYDGSADSYYLGTVFLTDPTATGTARVWKDKVTGDYLEYNSASGAWMYYANAHPVSNRTYTLSDFNPDFTATQSSAVAGGEDVIFYRYSRSEIKQYLPDEKNIGNYVLEANFSNNSSTTYRLWRADNGAYTSHNPAWFGYKVNDEFVPHGLVCDSDQWYFWYGAGQNNMELLYFADVNSKDVVYRYRPFSEFVEWHDQISSGYPVVSVTWNAYSKLEWEKLQQSQES